MNWIEVTISTTSEGADIVSQALYEVGVAGVVIEDPQDILLFSSEPGDWDYVDENLIADVDGNVLVKGYLEEDDTLHDRLQYIKSRVQGLLDAEMGIDIGPGEVDLLSVREEDWAENWKKHFKPKKIGTRTVIKPTWEEYMADGQEIVIEIDPGMAFGTGTHETTTLCIQMLEKYVASSDTVLDMGCGTGILAIASILLGADRALAVDIDKNAVNIAMENSKINNVNQHIDVVHGDLLTHVSGKFDIVVSNIIADVIIELSHEIDRFMERDGIFIASGIILDRLDEVRATLKDNGFEELECLTLGEWAVAVSRYG